MPERTTSGDEAGVACAFLFVTRIRYDWGTPRMGRTDSANSRTNNAQCLREDKFHCRCNRVHLLVGAGVRTRRRRAQALVPRGATPPGRTLFPAPYCLAWRRESQSMKRRRSDRFFRNLDCGSGYRPQLRGFSTHATRRWHGCAAAWRRSLESGAACMRGDLATTARRCRTVIAAAPRRRQPPLAGGAAV